MRERAIGWWKAWRALSGHRLFLYMATALVAGFGLWASLARIDVVARAAGEVIPSSQVKSVQHLEGGIVAAILVREGDRVTRDQPLIGLESTAADTQVDELTVRLTALALDVIRLKAEAAGADKLDLPPDLERDHPAECAQARTLFQSRRERLASAIVSQQQAINQREQALAEIAARLRGTRNALKLADEQVRISEELLKDDLTNRYNHLTLMREQSLLRGKIEEDEAASRRAEAAIAEAKAQIAGIRRANDQDVQQQLAQASRDHDEFAQRQRRMSDSQDRTVIRSPVDGVVKTLYVVTTGGVIQAGKTVVDIVPVDDRLVVEARLPVYDVGHVHAGQAARLSLASNEGARFGTIDGTVTDISPDTLVTDKGQAYYRVRVETAADHFTSGDQVYRLFPGVQVEARIITGDRSVARYLADPFIGYADQAMQER